MRVSTTDMLAPDSGATARVGARARLVALYLPQFHPVPENDAWWGPGFTEWTNVSKSRPLFKGHDQPRIPADLGHYDLRVPEVRAAQAEMARAHGIEGFCYYHYWFGGRRLLERPFNEVLRSGEPDFPFCLAWANESWSRRWLGEERSVLMEQIYSAEDDLNHARWLLPALADPRSIRVHGRPLFLIYRPRHLADPRRTTDTIRAEVTRHGLAEPYLVGIDAHCSGFDCREIGFDETLVFEPQLAALRSSMRDGPGPRRFLRNLRLGVCDPGLKIYDYAEAREAMRRARDFPHIPSVCVGWDNTPRRGRNGVIFVNSTPERFEAGLKESIAGVRHRPADERFVFINAWNEWAEGNHLEPDVRHGTSYLEAVARSVRGVPELALP